MKIYEWGCRTAVVIFLTTILDNFTSATEFGVSSSSYQVEGACGEGGRTPSVWDAFSHTTGKIHDNSNGDVAADYYHRWQEDIDYADWLGAKAFRFSLSWTRVFPNNRVNEEGVDFYNKMIDYILSKNMTPLATIFHWDSPEWNQEKYGGWLDDRMIDDIVSYAGVCFEMFGDRVRYWITLNEPLTYVNLGYGNGYHAPGISAPNPYEVAHRSIVAHARIYKLYHKEYASRQCGKISIALNSDFVMAADPNNQEDQWAAERGLLWRMGLYADPLFFGEYPEEVRKRCGGRLPIFDEDVSGTLDFFSLNHYTTLEARPNYNQQYTIFTDPQISETFPSSSIPTIAPWLHVFPQGIYGMIGWIQHRYDLRGNNLDLVITESGVATPPGQIDDDLRITYLDGYIQKALQAQTDFGVNLTYYCVWSLTDNWEWAEGYTQAFGLISIDFNTQKRTPKKSAYWFKKMLRHPLP